MKKRKKSTSTPKADFGTPEASKHHQIRIELASTKQKRARVVDQTLLDQLFLTRKISESEFDAGEQMRNDFHRAQMLGCPGSNPNRTTQSGQKGISDKQANALTRIGFVFKALNEKCGPHAEDHVIQFLVYDRGNTSDAQLPVILQIIRQVYDRWFGARIR